MKYFKFIIHTRNKESKVQIALGSVLSKRWGGTSDLINTPKSKSFCKKYSEFNASWIEAK